MWDAEEAESGSRLVRSVRQRASRTGHAVKILGPKELENILAGLVGARRVTACKLCACKTFHRVDSLKLETDARDKLPIDDGGRQHEKVPFT